jgi:hypothetical protein
MIWAMSARVEKGRPVARSKPGRHAAGWVSASRACAIHLVQQDPTRPMFIEVNGAKLALDAS